MTQSGRRLFCDTSFFFAALHLRDVHHEDAAEIARLAASAKTTFCTTWDVVGETATLLRIKAGYRAAITFLDDITPALDMVAYDESVRAAAMEAFRRLGRDKSLSFCDALSFAVVTLLLGDVACLSFDQDFRRLGLNVVDSSKAFAALT